MGIQTKRSRPPMGSRLRTRSRVFALIALVWAVLFAAPAQASAPMCDEQAQSIAAPLPVIPHDDGWIRGCQRSAFEDGWPGQAPDPRRSGVAPDRVDPAVLDTHRLPPTPKARRLAPLEAERPGLLVILSGVYRPPR